MKTRSQTKKEKLDGQSQKLPQLNEDILGIILKHVVRMEQERIWATHEIIRNHFLNPLKLGEQIGVFYSSCRPENYVEWPDYLDSNSRRLVHHTNVKLLPNCTLSIHISFHMKVTSKRELDLLWKNFKHFGQVSLRLGPPSEWEMWQTNEFFQELWDNIQARNGARDALIAKLERP